MDNADITIRILLKSIKSLTRIIFDSCVTEMPKMAQLITVKSKHIINLHNIASTLLS